jgi:LysR family nitrogen assimilation transcriptional regulator
VDLKQLTALVTVAEVGSVTKAARLLHLVQPAVTRQIRTLEDEVGTSLFQRTREGMVPTAAGVVMVERARRAILELERGVAEIRPEPGQLAGIVTVGVLESLIDLIPLRLVSRVRAEHPGIQLRIVTAYSGHLQQWLDSGSVDLSLLYNLSDTPSLSVVPLLDERLWAIAPADAGLVPERPVSWEEVLANPLVLPTPGHGLRALVEQSRAGVDIEPNISIETNSLPLQKQMVLGGFGWTVLPAAGVAGDVAAGVFSGAPLTDPVTERAVVLGLERSARTPPPVKAVAAELVGLVRQLVTGGEWPSAHLTDRR